MGFNYFDDLEDFDLYFNDGADADGVHGQLAENFGQYEALEFDFPSAAPDGAPHVLIGWRNDSDLALSLFAVPEEKLPPELRQAFALVTCSAYAYHEMSLGDDEAKAFQRAHHALTGETDDDLLQSAGLTLPDAEAKCLAPYRVAYFEHKADAKVEDGALGRRFIAAYSLRTCQ